MRTKQFSLSAQAVPLYFRCVHSTNVVFNFQMSTTPSTLPSTILYLNAAQWRKNNPYLRMAVWRCGCKGRNMRMSRLNPANGLNIRTRGGGNMPAHCSQDLGFVKWFFLGGRGGGGGKTAEIIPGLPTCHTNYKDYTRKLSNLLKYARKMKK